MHAQTNSYTKFQPHFLFAASGEHSSGPSRTSTTTSWLRTRDRPIVDNPGSQPCMGNATGVQVNFWIFFYHIEIRFLYDFIIIFYEPKHHLPECCPSFHQKWVGNYSANVLFASKRFRSTIEDQQEVQNKLNIIRTASRCLNHLTTIVAAARASCHRAAGAGLRLCWWHPRSLHVRASMDQRSRAEPLNWSEPSDPKPATQYTKQDPPHFVRAETRLFFALLNTPGKITTDEVDDIIIKLMI
jgi:hypothetical protein